MLKFWSLETNTSWKGRWISLCLLLTVAVADPLHALEGDWFTESTVLRKIHHMLLRANTPQAFIFIGEIERLGPVFQGICKEGVDEEIDFTVSTVVWGEYSDSTVHTGYINCDQKPLPSPPFTLHAKVIVYCDGRISPRDHRRFQQCVVPLIFSEAKLRRIKSWLPPRRNPH